MDSLPETSSNPVRSFLSDYKIPFILGVLALILFLIGLRILIFPVSNSQFEFIGEATGSAGLNTIIKVDISGAVINSGVYSLTSDERIQDLLVKAGGLAPDADREWVAKYLNLAGKLTDGTKIYIPFTDENLNPVTVQNTSDNIININNASEAELDKLPGVGEVTAQKIISGRPYGTIDELVSKKILSLSVFEKLKEKIGVY